MVIWEWASPEDGMVNLPLWVWFQLDHVDCIKAPVATLLSKDSLLFPVQKPQSEEYLLAGQAGLGLQNLPLVLGDPEVKKKL